LPLGRSPVRLGSARFAFFALLSAAIVQCGCWEGTTRETLATVLSVEGGAEISADGGRTFSPLRSPQTAGRTAVLRTGPTDRVTVTLLPNCLIHLEPDAALEIGRIVLVKDGNETGADVRGRFAEVKLIRGRIFVSHEWGEAPARLSVSLAGGELSTPSNAAFWAELVEEKIRVTCVSGWIEFRPSTSQVPARIRPGWIGQWPSAGENPRPADTDPRGQEDLQRAVELEPQMRELLNKQRNVLPR
jgi:hypothetical protein